LIDEYYQRHNPTTEARSLVDDPICGEWPAAASASPGGKSGPRPPAKFRPDPTPLDRPPPAAAAFANSSGASSVPAVPPARPSRTSSNSRPKPQTSRSRPIRRP
jgi:hypothetical protein